MSDDATNISDGKWVNGAPRRTFAVAMASVLQGDDEQVWPAVAMLFLGIDVEPITVTLAGNPTVLRQFLAEVDRAVNYAILSRQRRERERVQRGRRQPGVDERLAEAFGVDEQRADETDQGHAEGLERESAPDVDPEVG
jgi:hypothetical protein